MRRPAGRCGTAICACAPGNHCVIRSDLTRNTELFSTARLLVSPLRLDATPESARAALVGAGRVDWAALLRHADAHTIAPLLFDAWRQAGVLDLLPDEPRQRLAKAYADNQVRNGRIRSELLDVHQLLSAAQAPHLVLKGWPLVER